MRQLNVGIGPLLCAWLSLGVSSMASAQPVDPRSRAQDLLGQIDQALAARDGTRADKLLEQAMTRAPQPEVSLRLGRLAELEGRAVEALETALGVEGGAAALVHPGQHHGLRV